MAKFKSLIVPILLFLGNNLNAQKKELLTSDTDIIRQATEFITTEFTTGKSSIQVKELHITGNFILDITLYGKGQVLTVFSPFEIADQMIPAQNQLKDLIMACEFPFKLPKDKRIKFRYQFNFN